MIKEKRLVILFIHILFVRLTSLEQAEEERLQEKLIPIGYVIFELTESNKKSENRFKEIGKMYNFKDADTIAKKCNTIASDTKTLIERATVCMKQYNELHESLPTYRMGKPILDQYYTILENHLKKLSDIHKKSEERLSKIKEMTPNTKDDSGDELME